MELTDHIENKISKIFGGASGGRKRRASKKASKRRGGASGGRKRRMRGGAPGDVVTAALFTAPAGYGCGSKAVPAADLGRYTVAADLTAATHGLYLHDGAYYEIARDKTPINGHLVIKA